MTFSIGQAHGEPDREHTAVPAPGFPDAMARLAGGVALLTTLDPVGRDCGLTVTSVASVSLNPPLVLVCVTKDGFIHDALFVADGWSLSFLAADHADLARYGARIRSPGDRDDFSVWPMRRAGRGELVLTTGVAAIECVPHGFVDAGDHTIALGRAVRVSAGAADAAPLIHVDREYTGPGDTIV